MSNGKQITDWYKSLSSISKDDKADFEVMLLDHRNPSDAASAMLGLALNLSENGLRYDVMQLLFEAAKTENEASIQQQAVSHILTLCWLFDDDLRADRDIQESLLDMLADHHDKMLTFLHFVHKMHKKAIKKSHQKPLEETLIYHLIVVGEEARKMFE